MSDPVEALTNTTPLARILVLKDGRQIGTISDATMFVRDLENEVAGRLHWITADNALTGPSQISYSTRAIWNALATDGLLAD